MKVRMVTLAAGPDGIWRPGDVVDLPTAEAVALLNGGQADPVKEAGGRVAVPLPLERETAVLPQGDKETRRQEDKERADWTSVDRVSPDMARALVDLGIVTADDFLNYLLMVGRTALLAVPGIGPKTLMALTDYAEEAAGV